MNKALLVTLLLGAAVAATGAEDNFEISNL